MIFKCSFFFFFLLDFTKVGWFIFFLNQDSYFIFLTNVFKFFKKGYYYVRCFGISLYLKSVAFNDLEP